MDLTERIFQEELIAGNYHGEVICRALNFLETLRYRYPELEGQIDAVLRPVDDSIEIDANTFEVMA